MLEIKRVLDVDEFEPWAGAGNTLDNICTFGDADAFWANADEAFEGSIGETELNDLLWFEPELCYAWAGIEADENGELILGEDD